MATKLKKKFGESGGSPAASPFGAGKGSKEKVKKGIKQIEKIDALLQKTAKAEAEEKRKKERYRNACCICGCD